MVRAAVVLCLGLLSLRMPGVPTATALSMAAAAIVGFWATRLHRAAEELGAADHPAARPTVRTARLCDDGAVALCLLATLFALPI